VCTDGVETVVIRNRVPGNGSTAVGQSATIETCPAGGEADPGLLAARQRPRLNRARILRMTPGASTVGMSRIRSPQRTDQHADLERPPHQRRPRPVAWAAISRSPIGSACDGAVGAQVRIVGRRPSIRDDLSPRAGMRGQDPVVDQRLTLGRGVSAASFLRNFFAAGSATRMKPKWRARRRSVSMVRCR
jgi:hypothetical protein